MNLSRLNHILIPSTSAERERFRNSRIGKFFTPVFEFYRILTPLGITVVFLAVLIGGLGLQVDSTQVYLIFSALSGIVVAALLLRRPFALSEVSLQVRAPKRVAVGDEIHFTLSVLNSSERTHNAIVVLGPFLPWDGAWVGASPQLEQLKPKATETFRCRARFLSRGEHQLDPFEASALLPFGLTRGRPAASQSCRFMVVPKIAPVARLQTPSTMRYQPGGVSLASRTGESMELLGIRPYRAGDSLKNLHARSWARLGQPVVREYQEEYFTRVGVVVDTDSRQTPRKLEASLSLAAGLVAWLSHGEALIDVLVVGEQVHTLTLGRSLGYLDQALDLLACVKEGPAFDSKKVVLGLKEHLSKLSCVILVVPNYDEARRRFESELRASGVVCKTFVIDDTGVGSKKTDLWHGDVPTPVSVAAIERGEALWL